MSGSYREGIFHLIVIIDGMKGFYHEKVNFLSEIEMVKETQKGTYHI